MKNIHLNNVIRGESENIHDNSCNPCTNSVLRNILNNYNPK